MKKFNTKDFTTQIGCAGCLGYVVLFLSLSIILSSYGVNTLWAYGLMVAYVIVWGVLMFWSAYIRNKKTASNKSSD
jgi:hypothetical protein